MVEVLAPEDLVEDDWSDLSTSDLAPGARLGRYELLLPIAYGGMARVWAARQHGHRGFTKLVAIKTILPHLARDPEFERMFLDEARIAAGVHHPNVCEIYELGEEGRCLYLAMEWVNGESLVRILRPDQKHTQALDARVAVRVCAEACAGLHAAHELHDDDGRALNVVHRDVSPHNIMVTIDGTVKVADFGVAKAFGQMHSATLAGQIKGKVSYMAPEQITGAAVDRRSDIYSLGCVLYEATTGTQPFKGENDPQIMQQVLRGEFAKPSSLVKGFSPELERIIVRALAPDATKRYASAEDLRHALEQWLVRSGAVVMPSQVAAVVRERLGKELDKRKERIRRAANAGSPAETSGGYAPPMVEHTPSQRGAGSRSGVKAAPNPPLRASQALGPSAGVGVSPAPPSVIVTPPPPPLVPRASVPIGAIDLPPPRSPMRTLPTVMSVRKASTRWTMIALASVAFSALGVGAFFLARAQGRDANGASRVTLAASTMAPRVLSVLASASAASHGESAPTAAAEIAPSPIVFKVVPEGAVLVVEGKELAGDARTIPRPPPGKVVEVVVRAAGYQDEPLKIDDTVPATVDIWLQPNAKTGAGVVGGGAPANGPSAPAADPAATQGSSRGRPVPGLPANPF